MKKIFCLLFIIIGISLNSLAQHNHSMPHEMQHGFVLAAGDKFASHLVATGHHSRQTEIIGNLLIEDQEEKHVYEEKRQAGSAGENYYLFQAQSLDLPSLKPGQVLIGHIVESKVGKYDSKNIIVKNAIFKVDQVLLNIENPFFGD